MSTVDVATRSVWRGRVQPDICRTGCEVEDVLILLRGGSQRSPLPDFFIGAHAAVTGYTPMTRDAARDRTCFPRLP